MKNNNHIKKRSGNAGLLVIMIFWGILFFYFAKATYRNIVLSKNGIAATAEMIDVRKVGGKGIIRCTYLFKIENMTFSGKVDDDTLEVGDNVRVLYLKEDPSVNRALSDLE